MRAEAAVFNGEFGCPIDASLQVAGSRCSMLILREVLYGNYRFESFVERIPASAATVTTHLGVLVEAGLLERHPYRDPGARTRHEYRLTDSGRDFVPVLLALRQWGLTHTDVRPPVGFAHADCGQELTVQVRCDAGHLVESARAVSPVALAGAAAVAS